MKPSLLTIALLTLCMNLAYACPYCNIHNYLDISVKKSTYIYKGKILKARGKENALVQVIEVIRSGELDQIEVGQIRQEPFYHPKDDIGQTYIFSNPVLEGPTFPVLETAFEEEIRFLADSTREVTSIEEAIRRIEGVSVYSTHVGMDYVKDHYDRCYPYLVQRIRELKAEASKNPDYFFANHRISNLTAALFMEDSDQVRNFILNEIDSVARYHININWKDIPAYDEPFLGTYLRAMLGSSKEFEKTHELIRQKISETIHQNSSPVLVDYAYALAFDDYSAITFDELSKDQRDFVALGFYYAAKWNRYQFANLEKNPGLVALATQLSSNKKLTELIGRYFKVE